MNRRLIHIHGGFRLLIYGHSAHALEIEAQQRGVSLQPNSAGAYRRADISRPHDSTHTSWTRCCSLRMLIRLLAFKSQQKVSAVPLLGVGPSKTSTYIKTLKDFKTVHAFVLKVLLLYIQMARTNRTPVNYINN